MSTDWQRDARARVIADIETQFARAPAGDIASMAAWLRDPAKYAYAAASSAAGRDDDSDVDWMGGQATRAAAMCKESARLSPEAELTQHILKALVRVANCNAMHTPLPALVRDITDLERHASQTYAENPPKEDASDQMQRATHGRALNRLHDDVDTWIQALEKVRKLHPPHDEAQDAVTHALGVAFPDEDGDTSDDLNAQGVASVLKVCTDSQLLRIAHAVESKGYIPLQLRSELTARFNATMGNATSPLSGAASVLMPRPAQPLRKMMNACREEKAIEKRANVLLHLAARSNTLKSWVRLIDGPEEDSAREDSFKSANSELQEVRNFVRRELKTIANGGIGPITPPAYATIQAVKKALGTDGSNRINRSLKPNVPAAFDQVCRAIAVHVEDFMTSSEALERSTSTENGRMHAQDMARSRTTCVSLYKQLAHLEQTDRQGTDAVWQTLPSKTQITIGWGRHYRLDLDESWRDPDPETVKVCSMSDGTFGLSTFEYYESSITSAEESELSDKDCDFVDVKRSSSASAVPTLSWLSRAFSAGPKLSPIEFSHKLLAALGLGNVAINSSSATLATIKARNGTSIVLTQPGHDLPGNASLKLKTDGGSFSISDVIKEVSAGKSSTQRILIPIAQSNRTLLFFRRAHFVLLDVKARQGRILEAKLYDPKGSSSFVYDSLGHVTKQLGEAGTSHTRPVLVPLSQQKLFDFNDCDRFVVSYVRAICAGATPESVGSHSARILEEETQAWVSAQTTSVPQRP